MARRRTNVIWMLLLVLMLFVALPFNSSAQEGEGRSVNLELVAEGLTAPVAMANDGSGRNFIVDQAGMIWVMGEDGTMMADPFLDLSGLITPMREGYDERGVLGMAFHPDYANNGRFFVYYTMPLRAEGPAGWDHTNVLAEFAVSADNPNMGDLASQKYILLVDQPQFNHDAGHITFGPDGYLYVPLGDGGGGNDNQEGHTPDIGNGQDTTNLHGSILRLDVDSAEPYAIPADNPFVGDDNILDEIWAYGFRNPYHIAFDRGGDNHLFVGDAGQELYEEVSVVTAGGNYGWNIKEGAHCFDPNNPETPPDTCASTGAMGEPLIDPIIEYDHEFGNVVVGGYVYRGSAVPDLEGYYIFGSYAEAGDAPDNGLLFWAAPGADGTTWDWGELNVSNTGTGYPAGFILGIGQDMAGELYVLTSNSFAPTGDTGKVWRIAPGEPGVESGGGEPEVQETPESSG